MGFKALIATVAGAVVLVVWGMVFWGLLAPRLGVFHALPNAGAVTAALVESDTRTGTYFMPWPRDTPEEFRRFVEAHKTGPFYRLGYVREGVDPNHPAKLMLGTLQYVTVAGLGVAVALLAGPTRLRRFLAVLLGGTMASDFITVGDPVWFHMPWDYTRGVLVYELVAWVLLGAVAARLLPAPRA